MKGSQISPSPAAKAAHLHTAGLLRQAITKQQSDVRRTFHLLRADYIVLFLKFLL
ncbi:hypothetical protein [Sporosarcina sp. E16_8]|uniref:hypothetical protein n=1 Tax=Sporosarcina sp. E16_8 TaxID=2789295 RepID=UPI001A91D834|nr:hypothetical protein [Sporosarcina sp. E16_8]MBO0586228.1 hypothetical protein [Sporosarcina sp. E16_8]